MVILDAEKMAHEKDAQEKAMKARKGNGPILMEGAFDRAGKVFELHDVPKLKTDDMVVFTGKQGNDHRERRVRMRVSAATYNMTTNEWYMVTVAMVPATPLWNYESVTEVVKSSRSHTDIDLISESAKDSPVIPAIYTAWEAFQQAALPPVGMIVMGKDGCGDPDCEACNGDNPDQDNE